MSKFQVNFNVEKITYQSNLDGNIFSTNKVILSGVSSYELAESYIEKNIKAGEHLTINKIYVGTESKQEEKKE